MDLETLRYPIGRFDWTISDRNERGSYLQVIADTPKSLRDAVAGLSAEQLDTPYRPDGWRVRQVVHHFADDHMNSYVRFKWALTEGTPEIKGYLQSAWAELPDARSGDIEPSLALLEALHLRWMTAWRALDEKDWQRSFLHPKRGPVTLEQLAAIYAWHGKHHVAQIRALRSRSGW